MLFENLTNDNVLIYAMKAYDKPNMLLSEFKEDYKRFEYLKRLFRRYRKNGEIKEQLILNHLVVVYNIFGTEAATRLLFFKVPKDDYSILKTYLLFLNYMPNVVRGIKGQDIISSEISVDMNIAEILRQIK